MKKIIAVLLMIVMTLSLASCTFFNDEPEQEVVGDGTMYDNMQVTPEA